ncbi:MAG: hypothetical protein IKU84_00825 [Clostridia bacterium]|nr:hypothetical protein [Clostridia bacterium]
MDKLEEILNSPEAMEKVLDMAQSIMGGKENTSTAPDMLNGLDPKMLRVFGNLMQEFNNTDDRRFQFLNALRPYMGEGNGTHIDKAVQIMRLSRVISHLFKNFGGDKLV